MVEFITKNKEWLFSGVGVTVFIALIAVVRKVLSRKRKRPGTEIARSMTIHLNPSSDGLAAHAAGEKNLVPLEKVSSLSFYRIGEMIDAVPPHQQDEIRKHFVGTKVSWDAYLNSATKNAGGIVTLYLSPGPGRIDRLLYQILCQVALDDYRELSVLPDGARMRIEGEIAKADKWDVELSKVKLYFFENYINS
ncbi:MAG: hypothetical protein ABSC55_23490 [Syntrophorhabdales bacterium]|jgi:hypothetical protein